MPDYDLVPVDYQPDWSDLPAPHGVPQLSVGPPIDPIASNTPTSLVPQAALNAVQPAVQGAVNWAAAPGQVLQSQGPQVGQPWTDEDEALRQLNAEAAPQWGAQTALNMVGVGTPFAETGAAGVAGGKLGDAFIARGPGENIGHESLDGLSREGHFYRGMSEAEYNATIGSGKGIQSNLSASIPNAEGTNFSSDLPTAESYANFGRTDPRITGLPNYLVEVSGGDDLIPKRDGYFHARNVIPPDRVTRVWQMSPTDDKAIVATPVKLGSGSTDDRLSAALTGMNAAQNTPGIRAYHGSPYDFDRFDSSQIGAGEGAQVYGHGLYFAENPGTAQSYRNALAPGFQRTLNGIPFENLPSDAHKTVAQWMASTGATPSDIATIAAQRAAQTLKDADPSELGQMVAEIQGKRHQDIANAANEIAKTPAQLGTTSNGKMYEVNINADPSHFLDWDKPLSEQSPRVQEAIKKLPGFDDPSLAQHTLGKNVEAIAGNSPAEASMALRDAGIPGIKYLDQGSRGSGDGTHNYVVFSDDIVKIIKKYGLAGLIAGGASHFSLKPTDKQPDFGNGMASGGSVKATKTQAHYRGGTKNKRCGVCSMFQPPNSCTSVRGHISDKALCDYFEARKEATGEPAIVRKWDVPYLAGSSNDDKTVYIDRRVPKRIAVKRANGKGYVSIDPAEFLAAHETSEHKAMRAGKSYEKAHIEDGTAAERALVKAKGLLWSHYEEIMDGLLSHIEHEHPKRPPPDLYTKPYPHSKAKLLEREAKKEAA